MMHLDYFCVGMLWEEMIKNVIPDLIIELEVDNETDTVAYELLNDYVI